MLAPDPVEIAARQLLLLRWFSEARGSDAEVEENPMFTMPAYAGQGDTRELLIEDLVRAHLVGPANPGEEVLGHGGEDFLGHTTDLGRRFLRFISDV
ncbi:hypothetical protein AB0L70_35955 [Kribbella sp. NPDC051952]|uniref:hypothetical protein n=1 Tax=Kribbella sp. NPDC051952 TaxID=3154851 RepID=UPI0034324551